MLANYICIFCNLCIRVFVCAVKCITRDRTQRFAPVSSLRDALTFKPWSKHHASDTCIHRPTRAKSLAVASRDQCRLSSKRTQTSSRLQTSSSGYHRQPEATIDPGADFSIRGGVSDAFWYRGIRQVDPAEGELHKSADLRESIGCYHAVQEPCG